MNWKMLAVKVLPLAIVGTFVLGFLLHGNQMGALGWVWV